MKAVRLFEFGGPDALVFGEHDPPQVGPDDVLVKVMATSVSRWDVKYRDGAVHEIYRSIGGALTGRRPFPMPMQLGRDVGGIVEGVGANVTSFRPGDRVVGLVHPDNPLSTATVRGLGNLSTGIDLPGHTMFGAYAQFVSRPVSYWLPLPAEVGFVQAAAGMWAGATAHHAIVGRLGCRPGDTLLIAGASGGMGIASVQMAKAAGATVLATTRASDKAVALRAAGADVVLDAGAADALAQIRAATDGEGVDAAIDYAGTMPTTNLCLAALRLGGRFGAVAGEHLELAVRVSDLVNREITLCGIRASTRNDQRIVVELMRRKRLQIPIHATFPLAAIADAHREFESGRVVGKVIVTPWDA